MKLFLFVLFATLVCCLPISGQTAPSPTTTAATASDIKPKKQIFRPSKVQIKEVQTLLKTKNLYSGEATGKLDEASRTSIKTFQNANGLKDTGTLNRATLEKMGIELTDKQKLIPVSESSYASAEPAEKTKSSASLKATADMSPSDPSKPKKVIFRATKDQISDAQKMLKAKGLYSSDENGKLDDATRESLRKYQGANELKVTGTLNQITLEKMGIALTDKQKADAAASQK